MKKIIYFLIFISLFFISNSVLAQTIKQEVRKENLTKKVRTYYDAAKLKPLAVGSYYVDDLGETTELHGKWLYYDKFGEVEEERNYYRDKLQGRVVSYWANKKIKQDGYFKNNMQDSVFITNYESGLLETKGYFSEGNPTGVWTYFYLDGKEKLEENFVNGVSKVVSFWLPDSTHKKLIIDGTGELITFYTDGQVKEYYNYKDGFKNGKFQERSVYGHNLVEGEFLDNLKTGEWKYRYYTGALEKISHYKNDLLEGEYTYYFDNGVKNVTGYYTEGKKSGNWVWYTNKATKDMQGDFLNDLQQGKWTYWFPTGEISYYAEYDKGLRVGTWTYYYQNGQKYREGTYSADKKNGVWRTWYENGVLLMEGKYVDNLETGLWTNNWDNGKVKNQSTFKNGMLDGDWFSYYESGKPKLTGKYKENLKTAEWIDYYENGKPKDIFTYKVVKKTSDVDYGIMKDRTRMESVKDGTTMSFSSKDFRLTETGNFKNGEKDGEWIDYYPGGKTPAVIAHYKEGKLDGSWKQFDKKGNILTEMNYKNGLKDGKLYLYDKKGKVLKEKTFKDGVEQIEGTGSGTGFGM